MRKIFLVALVVFQSFCLKAEMKNSLDDSLANETKALASAFETKHFTIWYQTSNSSYGKNFSFLSAGVVQHFSEKYEQAYDGIEKILSRSFDANHFHNQKIEVFLTKGGVSHVYGGYHHSDYDKPWIYLPAMMVKGDNSFYSHELTHIMAWKSSAHSLREGLACWMQIKLYEDGIGLNTKTHGFSNRSEADNIVRVMLKENKDNAIFDSIGTPGIPSGSLTQVGGDSRSDYYTACYSFVAFLLDSMNMNDFIKLYEADDLPKVSKNITKKDMNAWKALWIKYLNLDKF
jgi:hypothetical protein